MMQNHQKFKSLYSQLNPGQKKAVDTIDGPVMVLAGPGTGKTQVLTMRIANIITKTDTPPYAILALTFTDAAATNMRRRLVTMIGKTGYYVNISTFHSFCSDVIIRHPEFFPIERGSQPLTDILRYQMFEEIITDLPIRKLKPINRPFLFLKDIISTISNLKREGLGYRDFKLIIDKEYKKRPLKLTQIQKIKFEKDKIKNRELYLIYQEYEKRLRKSLRFDYDDMIKLVVDCFKTNKELLLEYQEKLHYFLVDEYQDSNSSQNRVIELLAGYWGQKANIFVVGDPSQSIFRFQGASVENTLEFIKKYPRAKIINLQTSYRCPQVILQVASGLNKHNLSTQNIKNKFLKNYFEHPVKNIKNQGEKIRVNIFSNQNDEIVFIAKEINKLIKQGISPEEICVLYHNNYEAEIIKEIFDKFKISWQVDSGINILEHELTRQLLVFFKVIFNQTQGQNSELFELFCYDWVDLDKLTAIKIASIAGQKRQSIEQILEDNYKRQYQKYKIKRKEFIKCQQFVKRLRYYRIDDGKMIFTAWFEKTLNDSGYLDYVLTQNNRLEIITVINKLYSQIKSLVAENHSFKLGNFLTTVNLLQQYGIGIISDSVSQQQGVHLSTVHKAKGQEWEYVFITGFIEGKWANSKKPIMIKLPSGIFKYSDLSKIEKNEDERRLFYVGLTRTKKQVLISYPLRQIKNEKLSENIPSMFLMEIDTNLISEKDYQTQTEQIETGIKLLKPRMKKAISYQEKDFFQKLISDFKLTPTALDTYLRNEHEFIENIILKVPKAKPEHMAFGTAIHKSLENFYKYFKQFNKPPQVKIIQKTYKSALEKELVNYYDFKRRLEYGFEVLKNYHQHHQNYLGKTLMIEQKFGTGLDTVVLDDIYLSGRIDRIDVLDQLKKYVKVIDYKTGKARSFNDIEGKVNTKDFSLKEKQLPETIRGQYKRQLLFYKLLCQLHPGIKFEVVEGEFEFVEPDKKTGKIIKRSFELKNEDVKDLKELIRQVISEIRALKFLESYYLK